MRNFVVRLFVNALALWAAAELLAGVELLGGFADVLWVALVFGLVNAFLKPIVMLLSFPVVFLTLGLFTLVINAGLLLLTDALTDALTVDGFGAAFLGALVVSVVSLILSAFLKDEKKD
jgi:putative membrane protein